MPTSDGDKVFKCIITHPSKVMSASSGDSYPVRKLSDSMKENRKGHLNHFELNDYFELNYYFESHSMCRRDGLFSKIKDHFESKPHVSIGLPWF